MGVLSSSNLIQFDYFWMGAYALQFMFVPGFVLSMNFDYEFDSMHFFLSRMVGVCILSTLAAFSIHDDKDRCLGVATFFNAGVWVFGPLYAQFIGPSVDSNFPKLKPEHLIPFCVQTAVVLAHLFVLFTLKPKKKGGRKSS